MSFLDTVSNVLGLLKAPNNKPTEGFSVSEFKSNALRNGYLRPTLYLVNFSQAKAFPNNLLFFTNNVNIPAIDLDSQVIRRYGYGPMEKVPHRPVFTDLTMNFMVENSQNNILSKVTDYLNGVTSFMKYNDINDGSHASIYGASTAATPYEVAYKDDYKFDLEVYVYNETDQKILIYTFRDCYARTVGGVSLAWDATDSLLKAEVTFSFTDFSITTLNSTVNGSKDALNSKISSLQNLLGLKSLSQAVSAIQMPQTFADVLNVVNARSLIGSTMSNGPGVVGGGVGGSGIIPFI